MSFKKPLESIAPHRAALAAAVGKGVLLAAVVFGVHYSRVYEGAVRELEKGTRVHRLAGRADWAHEELPPFCDALVAKPERRKGCKKGDNHMCLDGTSEFFSQTDQDFYVYDRHFSKMTRRGVYLDVAANEAVRLSNTYFFDRCLGWSGLCVEGNPTYLEPLYRERSCSILPTCVSNLDGIVVEFALHGGVGGIVSDGPGSNKNDIDWEKRKTPIVKSKCTTMGKALARANVRRVDYMSLDVEGHELQVLEGFDWERVVIDVITIECNNQDAFQAIARFLATQGYTLHTPDLDELSRQTRRLKDDAIFVHSSVVWGSPQ